ncbi:class I SAM-dependent methyltransferase [Burkholderia gladioli]|uniref:class I SAM-dependent methyltransferase n=1 Tax=Burkholderia gladioli TaxID=28095 RepID=UPI000BBD17EE|nr:methyltransferase domain-containing protein [Burkholderia gladioli]ATF86904.1 hypothetical protein CO712_18900 [Burkholderia gladioli pv. gladioli]
MSLEDARARVKMTLDALPASINTDYFRGAKVLDIGCGTGSGVIAALRLGAAMAVGVDRDANEFGYPYFKEVAVEYGVNSRPSILIEGDIFDLNLFCGGFDIVMMYDAIEHVPNPKAFVEVCGKHLRPGGVGLIVTCPLYYSAVGHHLWGSFPESEMPWAHLYYDFQEKLEAANIGDWALQRFRELNKVTKPELIRYIREAGMAVLSDKSIVHPRFPPLLEKFGHLIDMSLVPSREDLLCDNVSLLFTKGW